MNVAPFLKPESPVGTVLPADVTIKPAESLRITSLYKYGLRAFKKLVSLESFMWFGNAKILSISNCVVCGNCDLSLKAPIINSN